MDNPEGGLDALLQVMVCKDRIGWRPDSRKIILVATDNDYHNAMDGKLAGTTYTTYFLVVFVVICLQNCELFVYTLYRYFISK